MQITITGRALRKLAMALAALLVIAGVIWFLLSLGRDDLPETVANSKYEAVTLTGGQVFFGDLQPAENEFHELRKAHHITQQPAKEKGGEPTTRVVPVTSDAIQPESSIFLPEDQITLVQPLKDDSVVTDIIDGKNDSPANSS